jgi:hypothetical protein
MSSSPLNALAHRALAHQLLMLTSDARHAVIEMPSIVATATVITRAEQAECTCPDPCERDHEFD